MNPDLKTMLVLNPHAGKGKGLKTFAAIRELLGQKIKTMEVKVSDYAGHAFQIGREAASLGYERILTVGGDGTPFEIVNGLYAEGRPRQAGRAGHDPGRDRKFLSA